MCEAETLIFAIEKYPCLWDIHSADYHNRDAKDLAWELVCKEVINDWETRTDTVNKCADLKKKWTHIRDYYRKDLQKIKNAPTGSAAKKTKKYVYADMFYFIAPIFDKRNSEGNYQTDDIENTQPRLESQTQKENIAEEHSNIMQPPLPVSPIPRQQKKKDVPSQILNILQQREKNTQKPNLTYKDEDDDTKFLLSFRSHMKRMTINQKLDFQLGMLQLVKQISMGPSSSQLSSDYYSDNSLQRSEYSSNGSYTHVPVPQSSPIVYYTQSPSPNIMPSSPPATIVSSSPAGTFMPSSPAATFVPSTLNQNAPSNSRVIITSSTNFPRPQSTQSFLDRQHTEDTDAARLLEEESIGQYVHLK